MRLSKWFFVGCVFVALTSIVALTGMAFLAHSAAISDEVALGHTVWVANGCESCHSVLGQGGTYAPDLTHIVALRGADYLQEFFVNPSAFHPNQRIMPRLNITHDEVQGVLAYLQSAQDSSAAANLPQVQVAGLGGLNVASAPISVIAASNEDPQVAAGRAVYSTRCASCHSLAKDVIVVGPSFWDIGNRAWHQVVGQSANEYIRNSIVYPSEHVVDSYQDAMQKNLDEVISTEDMDNVVMYLLTLKDPNSEFIPSGRS